MKPVIEDIIYLLSCSINQSTIDASRVSLMDLDKIHQIASSHMVAALIGYSLRSANIDNAKFAISLAKAQRKMAILEQSALEISEQLEKQGIWHMFLKGYVLKQLYPGFGTREMADLDILVDQSRSNEVRMILGELGYEEKRINENNVDEYIKPPLVHIEIHKSLFGHQHDSRLFDYYANIKSKLLLDQKSHYRFVFSPEDFYIYMIAHEYKHYKNSGTGLRSLLDAYVFLREYTLDWEYVSQETEKLGIEQFEKQNRKVAQALFSGSEIVDETMLDYIVNSGTFGTVENLVSNRTRDWGGKKSTYLFRRLFGVYNGRYWDYIKQRHPFFYKHKILIPFLPFYRLFYIIKHHRKRMVEEIKETFKRKK